MFDSLCYGRGERGRKRKRSLQDMDAFRLRMCICQTYVWVCVCVCVCVTINDSKLHLVRRKTHWMEQMENWRVYLVRLPPRKSFIHSATTSSLSFVQAEFHWNMVERHNTTHTLPDIKFKRRQCLCNYNFKPNINWCAFGKSLPFNAAPLVLHIFFRTPHVSI